MNKETFEKLWSPHPDAPAQNPDELFWLVNKVEDLSPKCILEIGVARGGSLRYWEYLAPPKIDGGLVMGIEKDDRVFDQMEEWWDWKSSDRGLGIIVGDSLHVNVITQVKRILSGRKLDFLFIDGNHDPEWIFREFVIYGEMVRYGGLIAFHDIRPEMHLQYVFNKLRGRTERYLRNLGIGIWWKEDFGYPVVFKRHDNVFHPFDLDEPQTKRLNEVWNTIKFDYWRE